MKFVSIHFIILLSITLFFLLIILFIVEIPEEANKYHNEHLLNIPHNINPITQESTFKPSTSTNLKISTKPSETQPIKSKLNLDFSTVLLIICANRPEYLERSLKHVLEYHPRNGIPIIISQDGKDSSVVKVIADAQILFQNIAPQIPFLHIFHPVNNNIRYENGYFKLADHYKWALDQVFRDHNDLPEAPARVIILEEDLEIAPDFFEYFTSLISFVDNDETILGVSAWNDNGLRSLVKDEKAIYRSDFFPGLGWMISRRIWDELSSKWPRAYWDDWLREPKQRKDRHILRPEVCRTLHFGSKGVSNSQYSEYLNKIKLNDVFTPFTSYDLSYLQKENWDKYYIEEDVLKSSIYSTKEFDQRKARGNFPSSVRIEYETNQFSKVAIWSGAMDNIKANVPRTAYRGIVTIWKENVKVHLVPKGFNNRRS